MYSRYSYVAEIYLEMYMDFFVDSALSEGTEATRKGNCNKEEKLNSHAPDWKERIVYYFYSFLREAIVTFIVT